MNITDELRAYVRGHSWKSLTAIADRIDAALRERYIELPMDADGVLIHIGDRMEHIELGYVLEVIAVGVVCFIAWNTHLNRYCQYDSKLFRHHHKPTIEDVLEEFASAYDRIGGEDEEHQKYLDLIAEYAAKLQLKEPSQ